MKIQDMVTWLEDRGFTVTKEYSSAISTYIFNITKDGFSHKGHYRFEPKRTPWDAEQSQLIFLDEMVRKWNAKKDESEAKDNMWARSRFPLIAAENNEGIVQIGAIKYPIRIDDITIDMDGTEFKATVLDPSVACYSATDYSKYDTGIFENWLRQNPWAFSGRKNGKTLYLKQMINSIYGAPLTIEKVIFNPPATIVLWSDGTKTVVKAQGYDEYDPEKGLAMAICKKVMGNKGNYNNEINKWTDQYWEKRAEEVDSIYGQFPNITEYLHCSPDEAVAKFKKMVDERLDKIFNKPESDVK